VESTPRENLPVGSYYTRFPAWLPLGLHLEAVPAGVHWDAICVTEEVAPKLLEALDKFTGAVIEDIPGKKFYWLVPPGAAHEWDVSDLAQVLSGDAWLVVPGLLTDFPCRWLVPLDDAGALTEPDQLHRALQTARLQLSSQKVEL
jgi:hypothetical protein